MTYKIQKIFYLTYSTIKSVPMWAIVLKTNAIVIKAILVNFAIDKNKTFKTSVSKIQMIYYVIAMQNR